MTDLLAFVNTLRRPKLLIRAARFGQSEYRRDRDLRRLLRNPGCGEACVLQLIDEEQKLEDMRGENSAYYSVARHIDVLIALLAETQRLPRQIRTQNTAQILRLKHAESQMSPIALAG